MIVGRNSLLSFFLCQAALMPRLSQTSFDTHDTPMTRLPEQKLPRTRKVFVHG